VTSQPAPRAATWADDQALIDACLVGADGAWESFVKRYGGLFGFVASASARQRGLPLAANDRDDLIADVLVECLRDDAAALRSFAGRSSLATYLVVIARRVIARRLAIDAKAAGVRSAASRTKRPDIMLPDEATRTADREHVERLLADLSHEEARLIRLHHLEHRSYGEISHLTGMPLNSIGPALSRAREKMRQSAPEPRPE
jgi:RNA polymerase sigma-70 factor (ECF subfamily)